MCFQAKPSPVFVLPPSALLCNQSETLPAAARGQESLGESAAVSPKCPPPLHSLPPHHRQSPTGQTDTGQAVARHCPLARKTSTLLHRGGQAKGGSATGLPTGWPFPVTVTGSNDISSCPPWPLVGGVGLCHRREPDSFQASRHRPMSSSSLSPDHAKLKRGGHPKRNRRPRQPGCALSRSPLGQRPEVRGLLDKEDGSPSSLSPSEADPARPPPGHRGTCSHSGQDSTVVGDGGTQA